MSQALDPVPFKCQCGQELKVPRKILLEMRANPNSKPYCIECGDEIESVKLWINTFEMRELI